jgi:hypothetical protein
MQMAGDQYASGELPLGDQHYVLDAPRKGYIYLCRKYGDGAGGAQHAGNWIHGDTWNWRKKISVQGAVNWSNAEFSITREGDQRILSGNGLPIDHTTGIFPIQPNDPASAFDRNPNSIRVQTMQETLPADPAYTDPPFCMGMEAGIMLDGVPLFNGFDAGLRDAAAHEVQDACQGHPQVSGQYHYHSLSSCIRDASEKTVIGYALDGFPITGPYVALGKYLTTGDLDECHGLTSEIIQDGQKKITYHYVMTIDFPYSVSCFRARPVRTGPPQSERGGMMQRNGGMNGGGMPMQSGPMQMPGGNGQSMPHRPPPEALDACSGRSDGDACAFIAPRGDQISGACHAPSGNGLACIPMR